MYVFNKITVNPQLPKKIERLSEMRLYEYPNESATIGAAP